MTFYADHRFLAGGQMRRQELQGCSSTPFYLPALRRFYGIKVNTVLVGEVSPCETETEQHFFGCLLVLNLNYQDIP